MDERERKLVAAVKRSRKMGERRQAELAGARERARPHVQAVEEAAKRVKRRRKITQDRERKLRDYRAANAKGAQAAIRWALAQVGTVEQPANSNRGPKITSWQQSWGSWLVGQAWCGVFVGVGLRDHGGVKGLTSRIAGVALIEDDAIARRNGFKGWHGPRDGQPGDAVVLFGRGVHVELIVSKTATGYVTVGGNTSPEGGSGSQSNGGGVFRRFRPYSVVRGCARPNY